MDTNIIPEAVTLPDDNVYTAESVAYALCEQFSGEELIRLSGILGCPGDKPNYSHHLETALNHERYFKNGRVFRFFADMGKHDLARYLTAVFNFQEIAIAIEKLCDDVTP